MVSKHRRASVSQPGSQFVIRNWKASDYASLASDAEHSESSVVDGDLTSALYIPSPADDRGLLVNFGRAILICKIELYAGDHDGDQNGDCFANDTVYGNDGSIELSRKIPHKTKAVLTFSEPVNLYNIFIQFNGHKQWLRVREVLSTAPRMSWPRRAHQRPGFLDRLFIAQDWVVGAHNK